MKKILSLISLFVFISIIVLIQSYKKEESNPVTPPTELPVYEGTGTVGSSLS